MQSLGDIRAAVRILNSIHLCFHETHVILKTSPHHSEDYNSDFRFAGAWISIPKSFRARQNLFIFCLQYVLQLSVLSSFAFWSAQQPLRFRFLNWSFFLSEIKCWFNMCLKPSTRHVRRSTFLRHVESRVDDALQHCRDESTKDRLT